MKRFLFFIVTTMLFTYCATTHPTEGISPPQDPNAPCEKEPSVLAGSDLCKDISSKTLLSMADSQITGRYTGDNGKDEKDFSYKKVNELQKGLQTYPSHNEAADADITFNPVFTENEDMIGLTYTLSFYDLKGKLIVSKTDGGQFPPIIGKFSETGTSPERKVFFLYGDKVKENIGNQMFSILFINKKMFIFLPKLKIVC